MKVEITNLDEFMDLIYECFNGVEVVTSDYLNSLTNSTRAQAVDRFIRETHTVPDEEDELEVNAIHAETMGKKIFNSFEHVFVENNRCYAVKDGITTMLYENMKEFNWFE